MSKTYKIAVLVGSLRKESINRKAAEALANLAPDNLSFDFLEIGNEGRGHGRGSRERSAEHSGERRRRPR